VDRRELVRSIGLGVLGGIVLRATGRGSTRPRTIAEEDLEDIARRIVRMPRERIFDFAEALMKEGVGWEQLEAAIFLAGISEISPRPAGSLMHSVLVVESVYQLADASPESERFLPVLWNLDDVKASQDRDVSRADWSLSPPPAQRTRNRAAARAELERAFGDWDAERADQAVVDLVALDDLEEIFEIVWRQVIRDLGSLGHKVIYAAQAHRTIARIAPIHPRVIQPALRSLAYSLTATSRPGDLDDHSGSVERSRTLPAPANSAEAVPGESLALAHVFVTGNPMEARTALATAWEAGASLSTAWDAVRLAACELFARGPGLLPVHPTTIANALHHIHRSSRDDETRRVALLQAAAWIPRLREALADNGRISRTESSMNALVKVPGKRDESLVEVLRAPTTDRVLACLWRGDRTESFATELRSNLYRAVDQNHQPKYAAALLEDVSLCHPRWRPVLLAPCLDYLPSARTPTTAVHERSQEALRRVERG
jgi:hypothetical protein